MTEQEWLNSTHLKAMLNSYCGQSVSKRKMRLFAVAHCRNIWHLLSDERSRKAVEMAERFADDTKASKAAHSSAFYASGWVVALPDVSVAFGDGTAEYDAKAATGKLWETDVLRDIFGNPFRPVSINSAWLTSTVTNLASAAYEERNLPSGELDATLLAVLADALEDAGCTNPDILGHLRSVGPHVRGCWVVDLLLGKQ